MKTKIKTQPPIFNVFFEILINTKTLHFVTKSLSLHKATDELYDSINELYDKFLESYMGKYNRPNFKETYAVEYKVMTNEEFKLYLVNVLKYFDTELKKYLSNNETELINIIDEMKLAIHKTLYLMQLI